jgi:hypothetical protein
MKLGNGKPENGRAAVLAAPLLDRLPAIDPSRTIADARGVIAENLRRIRVADEAKPGIDEIAAPFVMDARNESASSLGRSFKEMVILLSERQDDPDALRAMEVVVETAIYTIDVAAVRALARLVGSGSPLIAKTENRNIDYHVSVSDARSFLELKLNRVERALAAKEDTSGPALAFVDEGMNKAIDEVRGSFRDIVLVLAANPSDPLGHKALGLISSRSFIIKDKVAVRSLLSLLDARNGVKPEPSHADSDA